MPKLKAKYNGLLKDARSIAELATGEERDLSGEEKTRIEAILEDAKKLKGDMDLMAQVAEMEIEPEEAQEQQRKGKKGSVGEQFVSDDQFKSWLKNVAPSGRIPDSMKGLHSPAIDVKGLTLKTLVTGASATQAGAFIVNDDTGIYEPLGRYNPSVLDLIARRQTNSDTVEFVRQTAQVTQAAPTAEATATASSGDKPEGAMAFERVTASVKTIPVWVPATKQALSDAAQLRGLIDQEIREDLVDELANQVLNGAGGANFTGIYNTSNVLGQAYSNSILETTRKAITNLITNGKVIPTGWLIHPADWESIDLLKDAENRYYRGGPFQSGPNMLWQVPVVQSFHAVEGTPILGNWNKAVIWDREETTISVSDSHEDFFIRNMVAILGEMRAAFAVIRPSAFVEVSLSAS